MKIKSINIRNFRGFAQQYVEFKDNLTVIIGNNTVGKTTILKALQVGLGAFLQSLPTLPGGAAYRRNFMKLDRYKPFDAEKRDYVPNPENPRIDITADCLVAIQKDGILEETIRTIRWAREYIRESYTTHTRALAAEIMDYAAEISAIRRGANTNVIFPIVLSFGAKCILLEPQELKNKIIEKIKEMRKNYGS